MSQPPNILDDLFHSCALAAFVEQARASGGWPEAEPTRALAFQLYERHLAASSSSHTDSDR